MSVALSNNLLKRLIRIERRQMPSGHLRNIQGCSTYHRPTGIGKKKTVPTIRPGVLFTGLLSSYAFRFVSVKYYSVIASSIVPVDSDVIQIIPPKEASGRSWYPYGIDS